MTLRLSDLAVAYGAIQPLLAASEYLRATDLGTSLIELISMRASQINGCAHCLALHQKTLREAGEREDRLAVLPAWRESDWFSDRERAALAWTEAVTLVAEGRVAETVYESVRPHFSEKELADLTLAVVAINGWNRLSIAARLVPGTYQPSVVAAS